MKFDTLKLLFSMTSLSLLLGLLGMFFFLATESNEVV